MKKKNKIRIWILVAVSIAFIVPTLFFVYLLKDDPNVRYETDISYYVPLPENGEESFRRLMALAVDAGAPDLPHELRMKDKDGADYRELLMTHKELIDEQYVKLRPLFPQIDELAEYESIGDSSSTYDSPLIPFQGIRGLTAVLSAKVDLALIGEYDPEAVRMLANWISIMNAWLPHCRTLVHAMSGMVVQGVCLDSVERIYDLIPEDDAALLRKVISHPVDFQAVIQRALMADFCSTALYLQWLQEEGKGFVGEVLINKNYTINAVGDYTTKYIQLQEAGDFEEAESLSLEFEEKRNRFYLKNHLGWTFLAMSVPAANRLFENAREKDQEWRELLVLIETGSELEATEQ